MCREFQACDIYEREYIVIGEFIFYFFFLNKVSRRGYSRHTSLTECELVYRNVCWHHILPTTQNVKGTLYFYSLQAIFETLNQPKKAVVTTMMRSAENYTFYTLRDCKIHSNPHMIMAYDHHHHNA